MSVAPLIWKQPRKRLVARRLRGLCLLLVSLVGLIGMSLGQTHSVWAATTKSPTTVVNSTPTIGFTAIEYHVNEGAGTATIAVTLNQPNPAPVVSIDYATISYGPGQATPPADYTPVTGTLTIPQNAVSATFTVPIINDSLLERTEALGLTLRNVANATIGQSFASLLITDDDSSVCDFVAADEASLDHAIRCANTAGSGVHTIQVTADITLTQPSTLLFNELATQIIVEGNGHTLNANGHGRVLTLFLTQVTIHEWTLRGGRLPLDNTRDNSGGGIQLLGDYGNGTCGLTLIDSTLEDNEASTGGALANLCDSSTFTLTHSTIRNNRALRGGGIYVTTAEELFSESVIRNSQIVDNQAQEQGGGILFRAGDAGTNSTIIDSTIAGNTVISGTGGGLSVVTRSEPAITNVTLRNVTISGNQVVNGSGGGLEVYSRGSTNVNLGNVTISGNQATTNGGGILIQGVVEIDDTDVRLFNSTVAHNTATTGGGIFKQDGLLTLVNTLVAANITGGDCALTVTPGLPNRYVSNGHNLDSDGSCLPAAVRQASDIANGNANLSALSDFGGPTLTHVLRPGSVAIDAGDDAVCAADPVNGVDQRGVTRPQGAACDIGAVEMQASQSTSFTVSKFTDSNDGICDADCSLREAIGAANRNPGRDEIHLASGVYSVTIPTLTDGEGDTIDEDANAIGDLDIADDLLITGSGAASTIIAGNGATYLFGGGADRLFDILAQANVTIEDLTIQHGRVSEMGGGLSNSGVLALNRVHLVDNHAASGYNIGHGGGLFNDGTLTVMNSLIANNRADGGEASYGQGGGIRNDGVMTLIQSTVRDNRVWDDNDYGIGGGILNRGTLRVERSTLSGNGTAGGPGGALANLQGGYVEVINSTLSGNSSGSGGGLANGSQWEEAGTVVLLHATIADNRGGGLYNRGVTTATNTIIAGNPLDANESPAALNCVNEGTFVTLGANVMGDGGNCPTNGPGDLTIDNTTVFTTLLHPLADNGGNTLTHALVTASVANEAANDATCADERVGGSDQRGVVRPQGAHCDIGAYEAAVTTACTYPELVASDETTLRQAILCVNTAPAGVYTLTVTADIAYSQPMLPVSNPAITQLRFAGNGHTLDAQGQGRVLTLTDLQALTLHNLTLTGGQTDVNSNERDGGGVAFTCGEDLVCNWTVLNTTITDNHAYGGGGIDYFCAYHGNGTLLVQDSVISNNSAVDQGGGLVYSSDEESGPCSLAIRNSTIEGNQAVDGGGIRIFRPRVTISDSTLRNNIATQVGGGLMARISDGFIDMTVLRTTISGNQAGEGGGGVYIASPEQTFEMQFVNSTISGNTVTSGAGGGFYLRESDDSLRIALINSTVTNNAAEQGAGVHVFHQDSSFVEMTGTLRLTNSLIAENLGSDCGGETADNVPFSGQRVTSFGHNLDSDGTCLPEEVRQPSDLPNGNANLGPLADHGGATFTHALLTGSQAIDAGNDAICATEPVSGIDQRGVPRPQGAACDIGAYEAAAQPVTSNLLFVSSRSSATAGGVPFRDEDILVYAFTTNTWQMIFDGSDVGITKDVDAFAFLADGSLLLSFNGPTTVPGLGAVDDSDLVQFIPTALGSDTAGSFAWFLQGAAVGLTTDSEDIDAISFTADGHLVVSTIGDFSTSTLTGKDEDLIQLDDAANGAWSLFFDGSTVGLANEDVNGFWLDPASGERYLTVKDSFAFAGQEIDSDDIFVCTPTQAGGCTYRRFWDSDLHDYGSENIDSFHLGALPAAFVTGAQTGALEPVTPEAAAEDEDVDDLDVVDPEGTEGINHIFLPLVER